MTTAREAIETYHPPTLEEAISAFRGRRDQFIWAYMNQVHMAPHEITATWDQVPKAIRDLLPGSWKGFGLIGGFGVGKTFAISAAIRRNAERHVDDRMEKMILDGNPLRLMHAEDVSLSPWFAWTNWPGEVAANRALLFSRNRQGEVEEWIQTLQDPTRMLILDDIGADRATGTDWAGEVLARVIDERLRQQGPIIWTSNLTPLEIAERYGARTFSRLQALAPPIMLPNLPDRRLQTLRG